MLLVVAAAALGMQLRSIHRMVVQAPPAAMLELVVRAHPAALLDTQAIHLLTLIITLLPAQSMVVTSTERTTSEICRMSSMKALQRR